MSKKNRLKRRVNATLKDIQNTFYRKQEIFDILKNHYPSVDKFAIAVISKDIEVFTSLSDNTIMPDVLWMADSLVQHFKFKNQPQIDDQSYEYA